MVAAAKSLERDLRGRVAIELFELPERPSLDTMEDIVIPLMPFFDRLVARPRAGLDDYTVFANVNLLGVSIDLENADAPDLTRFWAGARNRRLAVFAHGVGDQAQRDALQRFEVEGMDGPALGRIYDGLDELGTA